MANECYLRAGRTCDLGTSLCGGKVVLPHHDQQDLLGSRLSTRVPMPWLRRILCTVLLMTGARMLWV